MTEDILKILKYSFFCSVVMFVLFLASFLLVFHTFFEVDETNAAISRTLFTDNGMMGIGTESPLYKLHVMGGICATDLFSGDGTQGITEDIDLSISGVDTCTLFVKDGLVVGSSDGCPINTQQ